MEPYNKSSSLMVPIYYKSYSNGVLVQNTPQTLGPLVSTLNGFKNPKWKDQVAKRESASTTCSGVYRRLTPGDSIVDVITRNSSGVQISSQMYVESLYDSINATLPSYDTALDNIALMRFYRDASKKINQASGLVFLGELGETVRQLKHPFRSMIKLLQKREIRLKGYFARANRMRQVSKRLKNSSFRSLQNAVGDTWLEVNFGLRPMISDIEDAATYLQFRAFQQGVELFPLKGTARKLQVTKSYEMVKGSSSDSGIERVTTTETRQKVRYIGLLKVESLNSWVDWRDFQRLGFSLRQFGPTLWEITPWSFLLDYFVDVGGLIESFNVPRESIAWFNKTQRAERKSIREYTGKTVPFKIGGNTTIYSGTSTPSLQIVRQWGRTGNAGLGLPRPDISFSLPNPKQFANIVALILSADRKRFSYIS